MPLKVSSNAKGTWITWEAIDESQTSTWRIKTEMTDPEMLAVLVKAATFIGKELNLMTLEIAELEAAIRGTAPAGQSTQPTSTPAASAPPGALQIPMMPPASLSDLPNGGPPVQTFGWASMPTTTVPAELAQDWEMIQPGEE